MSVYNIAYPNTITLPTSTASGSASTVTLSVTGAGAGAGYTLATGAGASGSSYTTSTISNGAYSSWANPNTNFYSSNQKPIMSIPHGEERMILEKEATLDVNGTVKINGIDLDERLRTIEKVLNIPTRDVIMENKYPKLKKLYDQYMHELEKMRTWDRVKGDD